MIDELDLYRGLLYLTLAGLAVGLVVRLRPWLPVYHLATSEAVFPLLLTAVWALFVVGGAALFDRHLGPPRG